MKRQTFILTNTKDFRRAVRLFLRKDDKVDQRNIKFTTEHKISEKDRNKNARKIPAEYSTSDEKIYDGLLRSHAYGKTFVLVGDPDGKLKREPFDITPVDAKKVALKNMFEQAGFEFDTKKSNEVLEEEYLIQIAAKTGVKIEKGVATVIPHSPINLGEEMQKKADEAREAYKVKYGESIPEAFTNDVALLDGLSNPDFDAKAYMDKVNESGEISPNGAPVVELTIEELREKYFAQVGVNVPNPKKNDAAWIKSKIN